jgi:type IV secretory pathway TrbF-like protein
MTPQEEEALVQVIVQCVRAVLEAFAGDKRDVIPHGHKEVSVYKSSRGSRFIDVVTPQGAFKNSSMNGNPARISNSNRDDVREALQRFLRNSEPVAVEPKPEPQQKRQLITQADILAAYQQGQRVMVLQPDAIVTPLARQIAKDKGVELR